MENESDVGVWERALPEGTESEGSESEGIESEGTGEGIESIERRDEERRDGGKD